MRITVHVKPRSRAESVERLRENEYQIRVRAVPEKGKANEDVIRLVAKYFGVSPSCVSLAAGGAGKKKILDIDC